MLRVGLPAWPTLCGGLGFAVAADIKKSEELIIVYYIIVAYVRVDYHNQDI